jgi:hypothetical protein
MLIENIIAAPSEYESISVSPQKILNIGFFPF